MTEQLFEKAGKLQREITQIDDLTAALDYFDHAGATVIDKALQSVGEAVIPFKDQIIELVETLKENKQREFEAL